MSEWRETEFGRIPYDWNFVSASDFCGKVTDGTHDSPKQQITGKHLITSKHIKGRHIDFENAYLISQSDYEKINERSKVDQWNVIISMIGEYCGFSYVERNEKIDYAVKNVGIFKTQSKASALWLHYYIQSKIGREYLESVRGGTSQPYLSLGALRGFPVLVPTNVEEQKTISTVLSSLDDKIDLLHRQNKTLEAMAETLFRQWFVEEAGVAWKTIKISDFVEVLSGFAFKSTTFTESGAFRLITIKAVQDGYLELAGADRINDIPLKMPDYCYLKHGDILLSLTGNVGRCCLVDDEGLLLNQRVAKLRAKNKRDWALVYAMFRQSSMKQYLEEMAKGTAQANLSPIETANMEVSLPPIKALELYSEAATPLLEKVLFNKSQIRTLEIIRDTLLPKLMSGEVRVALDS